MNEPKRLLVAGSPTARSLLGAGRREGPAPTLAPAVMGTLGIVASSAIAPSFGAKLVSVLRHVAVSKVSVGAVAIATASGGGYLAGRIHERALRVEPPPGVQAPAELPPTTKHRALLLPPPTPVPIATEAPRPAVIALPEHRALPRSHEVAAPPEPSATVSARPSIIGELDEIRRVRALVVAGSGTQAIEALDAYALSHPGGTFDEEALALRVRALRLNGDFIGAERSLQTLKSRYPGSIYLAGLEP